MIYIVILVLTGLLAYVVWQARRNPARSQLMIVVLAIALVVTSVFALYRNLRTPPPPKVPPQWNLALGEVLAKQISQLVPDGGRVLLFIVPESMAKQQSDLQTVRASHLEAFQRGLAKNLTVTVIDQLPNIPILSTSFLTPEALQGAIGAFPDAKAVVSFLPPSGPLPDLVTVPGTSPPKIIVFAISPESVQQDLQDGRLQAAVVIRRDPANLWKTPTGDALQIFESRYRLITRDNL